MHLRVRYSNIKREKYDRTYLMSSIATNRPPGVIIRATMQHLSVPRYINVASHHSSFTAITSSTQVIRRFNSLILIVTPSPFSIRPVRHLARALTFIRCHLP